MSALIDARNKYVSVLILVLVEVGFCGEIIKLSWKADEVLILVLVEVGFCDKIQSDLAGESNWS